MLLYLPRAEPIWQEKDRWHHAVASWRHTMTSHYIMSQYRPAFCILALKPENHRHHVFDLVTLTFALWPWPSNSSEISSRLIPVSNFVTLGQSVQSWECSQTDTHTHRQTDGSVFITSTADAGGNNYCAGDSPRLGASRSSVWSRSSLILIFGS